MRYVLVLLTLSVLDWEPLLYKDEYYMLLWLENVIFLRVKVDPDIWNSNFWQTFDWENNKSANLQISQTSIHDESN